MTFGVPVHALPITEEGVVNIANHSKWIVKRQVKEAALLSAGAFDGIDLPGPNDVLRGRGKPYQQHTGAQNMRYLVDLHLVQYNKAPMGSKTMIAHKIVGAIKQRSGRFLKRDANGWWFEVSDEDAIDRVCAMFRTSRAGTITAGATGSKKKRPRVVQSGCLQSCLGSPGHTMHS